MKDFINKNIQYFIRIHLCVVMMAALSGCLKVGESTLSVTMPPKKNNNLLSITVSNVEVVNHQLIITGTNLTSVNSFDIKDGGSITSLDIESKTSIQIVANTLSNVTFATGKILDFVFSNANAASSFTVNFSLCDSTLGGKGFSCASIPNNRDVLSYDQISGKWKPRSVNGISYKGAWNPSNPLTFPTGAVAGDYYIASDTNNGYAVGDWIVYNGASFDQITNSNAIVSVFGRTSAVVATKGDYELGQMDDVNLTVAPTLNQVLKYNGTEWVAGAVVDSSVKAFAKVNLPTCSMTEFLSSDGTNLGCATPSGGSGGNLGTGNRIVATNGSGDLVVTAITDTVFAFMSGVTSNIQAQINAKAATSSIVDWAAPNAAQTIDPTRLNLGSASRAVVTTAGGQLSASATTSTQIGYLSTLTSDVQTQLNTKLSVETNPGVEAFAKTALPVCSAGQVLFTNGTTLTCVTDSSGAGAFSGALNRAVMTDGAGALTTSTITNTELGYLSGLGGNLVTLLGQKQAALTSTSTVQGNSLRIYNTAGTFYTELASLSASNRTLTFPNSSGASGNVLTTDGAGVLSWSAPAAGGVTSVNTLTGAVTLGTDNVAEGATNKYYTDVRVRAATLTGFATGTNSAVVAGDTVLSAFGKIQTQINNSLSTLLNGLAAGTNTAIAAGDSILGALAKLQAQVSTKADTTNLAQSITASNITVTTINAVPVPDLSKMVANEGGAASVQIGTMAARPLPVAGNTGRMYVVNDSGSEAIYISTGTAWIKVASNASSFANGGTGSTTFTANKAVVVNSGGTALVDGPSIDDTTAVAATLVKRGTAGEVYGQYVVPTTAVVENAACTVPIGTIAKDASGNILTCQ